MRIGSLLPVIIAAGCVMISGSGASAETQGVKNVIVLISDGAGYNTWKATGYYDGKLGNHVVNGPGWVNHAVSNHPLRFGTTPIAGPAGLAQDPNTVYSPAKAYNTSPIGSSQGGYTDYFEGYKFHKNSYPDSANTMVSVSTGNKTYNNALNVDGNGNALPTLADMMKQKLGKSVGVVSTVQWADATPAALGGAVNVSRGNRTAVADYMLNNNTLDVIIGGGNPDYDNNAQLRATPNYSWISPTTWSDLKDGNNAGLSAKWQLAQDKADFEAAANGTLSLQPGKKFLGMHKSFEAHQAYRSGVRNGITGPGPNPLTATGFPGGQGFDDQALPFTDPRNTAVPSLPTMAKAAINLLDSNPNGFFVAIEAGGVDRAMHANALGRMIEDHLEFIDTVDYVNEYLNNNTNGNNWSNTLVIVTADHDHMLFGPDGDTNAYAPLVDNGVGNLPGHKWFFNSHSNFTVPLFAKGPGSELFAGYADQLDEYSVNGITYGHGMYLDQTEIHSLLVSVVPEPTALGLLGLPMLLLSARRR